MISQILSPTLVLDEARAKANIRFMAEKAAAHNLILRPHLKTPQSIDVARWYRDAGVTRVTVSSIDMAEYFASDGWTDITLAIPLNIRELPRISALARRIKLNLVVDSMDALDAISDFRSPISIFIKIDAGYHRTGIPADDHTRIESLVHKISSSGFEFAGFITHAGHSYACRSHSEIRDLHEDQLRQLIPLKRFGGILSIGDTPTLTVSGNFKDIDEIRPGNFIFYDMKMVQISACTPEKVAVCLVAPVISTHPDRNEVIINAGSVHFSKDSFVDDAGQQRFGQVVKLTDTGWSDVIDGAYVRSLCQEHGFVTGPPEYIRSLKIGDLVGVLPIHSCLTADCMGEFLTLSGDRFRMMVS
jgi:D-serine deaminase-like pyridoxal phosphate-dependent protein